MNDDNDLIDFLVPLFILGAIIILFVINKGAF